MQYKDKARRSALWAEKAQEMGLTVAKIQGWWSGMLTWYGKIHKTKSGQVQSS